MQSAVDKDWSEWEYGGFSWKGLVLSQCLDLFTKFFILSFFNNFPFDLNLLVRSTIVQG